ncbi:MAG: 3-hydroxyacyl-CoA dehydrogenase NAD-binding domain-containing protein [Woeseia sp.]
MTEETLSTTLDGKEAIHWQREIDQDGLLWLCIDKADGSANVLSRPVLEELAAIIEPLANEPPRGIVIHSGKKNGFIMGADINEFTTIDNPEQAYELIRRGQQALDLLQAVPCPSVAVIDGFALGGGLELALACDYRIVIDENRPILGLPEVQLGIHPGFGGTVRAVRICGVRAAMNLMLTGQSITPHKAETIRLVDRVIAKDDWKSAAKELVASKPAPARAPLIDRLLNLSLARPFVGALLQKQVAARARQDHYPAPYAIVDLWRKYGASERSGYEAEARSIASLMCGKTSRNLVRVFFLQNRLKSQGNKPDGRIQRVHVVGAGVMGGDIAAWCALRGLEVTLQDRAEKYLAPAMKRAAQLFEKKLRDSSERAAAGKRLRADVAGSGAATADLIIEAIFEDLDAKQKLYVSLQEKMRQDAILATNTSSIRLQELRTVLHRPERFIGLHFFNPVAKLPLVEIVRCDDTTQNVLDMAFGFVKGIGKFPLECASSPGFVVNRVLAPYMAEAMHLAESGVPLETIDHCAEHFGMPMGPVELVDSVGIDVARHVSEVLGAAFDRPVPARLAEMVEKGQLGRKSGQGFYVWKDGKAVKEARPQTGSIADLRHMQDRLLLPLVNEAVACLDEGVVADADLLDAGVIFGTGFAPFRGGPLNYARDRGIDDIVQTLHALREQFGDRFRPHAGWARLAKEGDVRDDETRK